MLDVNVLRILVEEGKIERVALGPDESNNMMDHIVDLLLKAGLPEPIVRVVEEFPESWFEERHVLVLSSDLRVTGTPEQARRFLDVLGSKLVGFDYMRHYRVLLRLVDEDDEQMMLLQEHDESGLHNEMLSHIRD